MFIIYVCSFVFTDSLSVKHTCFTLLHLYIVSDFSSFLDTNHFNHIFIKSNHVSNTIYMSLFEHNYHKNFFYITNKVQSKSHLLSLGYSEFCAIIKMWYLITSFLSLVRTNICSCKLFVWLYLSSVHFSNQYSYHKF